MTRSDCSGIVEKYLNYLSTRFVIKPNGSGCVVTTPFLRSNNDPYQMYVERISDNSYMITDFGDTLTELRSVGLEINKGKKKEVLDDILKRSNIQLKGDSLIMAINEGGLPQGIQSMLRAMDDIAHMEYFIRSTTIPDFTKKVHEYLLSKNVEHEYEETGIEVKYLGLPITIDLRRKVPLTNSLGILMRTYHVEDKAEGMNQAKMRSSGFYYLKVQKANYKGIAIVDDRGDCFSNSALKFIETSSDYMVKWEEHEKLPDIIFEAEKILMK